MRRILLGIALGFVVSCGLLRLVSHLRGSRGPVTRLVAEDASAPLARVAIHYAPVSDRVALPVWKQLFAALSPGVDVEVEVAAGADFERLIAALTAASVPHLERLHPVVVGTAITTWSRDRYAALVDDRGNGSILAPPRSETPFASRAGDARSPLALSHAPSVTTGAHAGCGQADGLRHGPPR